MALVLPSPQSLVVVALPGSSFELTKLPKEEFSKRTGVGSGTTSRVSSNIRGSEGTEFPYPVYADPSHKLLVSSHRLPDHLRTKS